MKNLLIALALVASSLTASATSIDRTPVVATVTGNQSGLKEVALLQDGRLQVVPVSGKVKTVTLGKVATAELLGRAQMLSDIEVKEERRTIVCRMMVRPSLSNLSVSSYNDEKGVFASDLRLILTRTTCADSHVVYPVESREAAEAEELKSILVILALTTLK